MFLFERNKDGQDYGGAHQRESTDSREKKRPRRREDEGVAFEQKLALQH